MSDLEQAGRAVVARSERGPTPLGRIEARARVLRRRRLAGRSLLGLGLVAALVAGVAVTLPGENEDVVTTEGRTTTTTVSIQPLDPSVTVEPSTGLSDGSRVIVSSRGFNPDARLDAVQCVAGADPFLGANCDPLGLGSNGTSEVGSGRGRVFVSRRLLGGAVDCAERPGRCMIGVAEIGTGFSATTPITFDPTSPIAVPTIVASPTTGLVDGQLIAITASGFRRGQEGGVSQCLAEPAPIGPCSRFSTDSAVGPTVVGPDGTARVNAPAMRYLYIDADNGSGFQRVDCAEPPGCVLAVPESANGPTAPVPLTFDAGPDLDPPRLLLAPSSIEGNVRVLGRGFPAGIAIDLGICPVMPGRRPIGVDCRLSIALGRVSASGDFAVELAIAGLLGGLDCGTTGRCTVAFLPSANTEPLATVDLIAAP